MLSNTDISKLKELYESLDRLKEAGEDVVAEIRKEINNIELQYLKENVFPEMMKTLSRKISWLRCSVDMSLQFDGEKQLDYSFCKSGSTVFVRDKYECGSQDDSIIEMQKTDATYSAIISLKPTSASATDAIVRIVEYSDKAIAVYGDTMRYSEKFKEIGGYFNDRLREGAGWIFSKKHELEVRNFIKDKMTDVYTENLSPSNIVVVPVKYELEQSIAVSLKNIKCTLEGFRTFLSMIKNNHGRSYSPSTVNVYCTATRSNYMRNKILKYHHSGYLYNLTDLRILSQLYDDVQADFEAKRTNSGSPQTIRLYIQFIETYFSDKKETDVEPILKAEMVSPTESIKETDTQTRAPWIVINSISFNDYIISNGNSTEKFIEFINIVGPKLVYQMKIPFRGGYLVDKTRNLKYITFCKPLNGGYWLNTHSSTTNKIELMKQIGEYLGTEVTFDIEEKDDNEPTATSSAHEIRHSNNMAATGRAKYSLNGGEPQNKRRTVHSVVSLYMRFHPRVTWREMLDVFPKELQGSYGVINTVESIQYRIKKGFDDEKRYFLDPSSRFTTIDGVVFAVCHQWGNQFDKFRKYVEDKLGWMIEEV